MFCSCGERLVVAIGDGYVITPKEDKRWMRRRSDYITCSKCTNRYDLEEIRQLSQRASA